MVTGRLLKLAAVRDEELVEGTVVGDPAAFVAEMHHVGLKADILSFPQAIGDSQLRHACAFEWDNVAAADVGDYEKWWNSLPQESRKNVRRAAKRGVNVKTAQLDEAFVRGIKAIYDESPVRQGMRFWHYGKSLERVRVENGTYPNRSEFIGAYYNDELIAFMKWVYVDRAARIMQILAMRSHYDKQPMSAMIAKAVEICSQKGMHHLIYSKFTFGNKANSQLTEFKRRNGFRKIDFVRYHMPLTFKGHIAVRLRLYRGVLGLLPPKTISCLWNIRSRFTDLATRVSRPRRIATLNAR